MWSFTFFDAIHDRAEVVVHQQHVGGLKQEDRDTLMKPERTILLAHVSPNSEQSSPPLMMPLDSQANKGNFGQGNLSNDIRLG